jgi:hypothetical protein
MITHSVSDCQFGHGTGRNQPLQQAWCSFTFAISLQLFPASLICFNLSSSAGVHGVFVRLFLSLGSCGEVSTSGAGGTALLAWVSAASLELDMVSGGWFKVTDLRLRFVGGDCALPGDS